MQQYRLNYKLLIGLVVGTLITSGAVFLLWKFQIERKSGVLLAEAQKAQEAGDYRNAVLYYSHYLSIHGQDNDIQIKRADAYADLLDSDDVAPEDVGIAIRVLEETVRTIRDAKGPQERLVELYGRFGRYQDALSHLELLLEKEPDDAELQAKRAAFLARSGNLDEAAKNSFKLIGYDPKTDEFDVKKATAPHDISVYATLASILRGKQNKPELADRVMDQLIEANPDSAAAYLSRGSYRIAWDEKELGQQDIDKAYDLSPKDADVLLMVSAQAMDDEQFDKAKKYLEEGKQLHKEDPRFFQSTADLEARQKNYDAALAEIDAGLKVVGSKNSPMLLYYKSELQFRNNDLKGVEDTIRQMESMRMREELIDWCKARILLANEQWPQAVSALNLLRTRAIGMGDLPLQIDNFLGLSYERMGRHDLAIRSYEDVLKQDPDNGPAKAGHQRVLAMLKPDQPIEYDNPLQKEMNEILKQPEDKRDWARLDDLLEQFAAEQQLSSVDLNLMKVNFAVARKDYDLARRLLKEAVDAEPENLKVYRSRLAVARLDPKEGPEKALAMWDTVARKFDDQPALRVDKADILINLKDEQLKPQLASLLSGIDKWPVEQKVELWASMAQRYLGLGMTDEAQEYLAMVADNRPNDLPTRMTLFALALETGDDERMKEAQKKILEIVKDPNDANYLYSEARRRMSLMRRGRLGAESLPEVRRLLENAKKRRPDWHELWLAFGDLEIFANNPLGALENYEKAEQLGRLNPGAIATYVRLLYGFGQFKTAGEMLERIPEQSRQPLLGQLYTEILFRTDKVDDAIREAREAAEASPTDPQRHFWHGHLLARSAEQPDLSKEERNRRATEAISALRKAVELEPELPDAWYSMVMLNAMQENGEAANQVLREAQLALSGDNLPIFLAKCYEVLGRWFDAETMYRAYFEMDPKNVQRAQQLAAFYLSPIYRPNDRLAKVTPLLNQIMKAAEETGPDGKKRLAPNDGNLLWARRKSAELLASTGDYQSIRKAEKLLASNSQDGVLPIEDRLQMAQILGRRLEPELRKKAIGLLTEVSQAQPLNEAAELALGQLYFATGDWTKCRRQMQKAVARFPNFVPARESYISMLLSRGDPRSYQDAVDELNKLRKIAPNSKNTFTLTVQLASKLGKQADARRELLRRLPKVTDVSKLTDEQADMLAFLASLFVTLGDLDTAEQIYTQLAERNPQLSVSLATFLGTYRDVGKAIAQLERVQAQDRDRTQEVLTSAINTLRARRDDVGDKYDAQVEAWLERALRENQDSISLLMLQADFLDVQRKYEEAAAIYRKLLARSDLEGIRRAIVLNNLAFLVALAPSDAASNVDPLKLVQEAEYILGPNADILDTKAVVLIRLKRYQEAIGELTLSVTDNPTPSKYFHLVQAYLGAGQNRDALQAWDKALALGLSRDSLNRLEFDSYDQIKATIDQLRGGTSVTQSQPARASRNN